MSYVLTFVSSDISKPISNKHVVKINEMMMSYDIQQTCEPVWLAQDKAVDIGILNKPEKEFLKILRQEFYSNATDIFINIVKGRRKKLLLADMDSTIVDSETLDELAEFAGLKEQISAITAQAMEGQLDFHDALRKRISLLKDLPVSALEKTLSATKINLGAKELVKTMSAHNATCVLVSGGFTFFTKNIAAQVGFHINYGNTLDIRNDVLTGQVIEPILDKHSKVDFLRKHVEMLGITNQDCMSIGDGANDLPMLELAGLGVGYKPKEVVKQTIDNLIIHGDLSAALYAQGYMDKQILI
ncbi:MAG: phosphoserine phosphatase SerB [Alphaproteobacteria bacterium]|nr:phosphoserine phosphatase SerB [Alphaproteobacteria bacterium]